MHPDLPSTALTHPRTPDTAVETSASAPQGRRAHLKSWVTLAATVAVGASIGTALGGCTTVVRVPAPPPPRVVVREMPAPVVEEVPAQPGPQWHWRPGHWVWHDNGGWRWQRGEWVATEVRPMPPVIVEQITVAPSPSHVWVRGHWVWRGNEWFWARGHWVLG